jgi:hypothetical protein
MNDTLFEAQRLIRTWMSHSEQRSLDVIKTTCEELAQQLDIERKEPIWALFWPLVYSGVIDHVGRGYYALTESLILDYGTHFYYVNPKPESYLTNEVSPGIFLTEELMNPNNYKVTKVNPTDILKHFPSFKDVVYGFSDETFIDNNNLEYYNNWNKGLAKRVEGMKRYFVVPEQYIAKGIPEKTYNPDAFAIAYSYSRVINQEWTGTYVRAKKQSTIPLFAIPFLLYRVLQLETMASRQFPLCHDGKLWFNNISKSSVKEINRILCYSINYEQSNQHL